MKKSLGGINALYPTPTVIVGAIVAGKPNFITIAHIGIVNHAKPHLISISLGKAHYTNAGIRENKEFSVNIPSESLVVETDYVGIVSGKKVDKSRVFELFYGRLLKAPLIKACPVCMECRLYDTYDTPTHDLFIGEIVETRRGIRADRGQDRRRQGPAAALRHEHGEILVPGDRGGGLLGCRQADEGQVSPINPIRLDPSNHFQL